MDIITELKEKIEKSFIFINNHALDKELLKSISYDKNTIIHYIDLMYYNLTKHIKIDVIECGDGIEFVLKIPKEIHHKVPAIYLSKFENYKERAINNGKESLTRKYINELFGNY